MAAQVAAEAMTTAATDTTSPINTISPSRSVMPSAITDAANRRRHVAERKGSAES